LLKLSVGWPSSTLAAPNDESGAVIEHGDHVTDAAVAGDAVSERGVQLIVIFDATIVSLLRAMLADGGSKAFGFSLI
jgi:hypothetical protein